MKLKRAVSEYEQVTKRECYLFECPGCGHAHIFVVKSDREPVWQFNGDLDKPTFRPSLLNRDGDGFICHLYITDGQIQFLGDCSHGLKGQTVKMLDIV